MISKILKEVFTFCSPDLVFIAKDKLGSSLHAKYAMDILFYIIDTGIIKLIGHWRINEMMCYLHLQSRNAMRKLSSLMLAHGRYYFFTHHEYHVTKPPVQIYALFIIFGPWSMVALGLPQNGLWNASGGGCMCFK